MKKFGFLLLAALLAAFAPACNDTKGDYPGYTLITTIHKLDNNGFYFQRDNGQTLYPGDLTRVPGFVPDENVSRRAIIWFNLLEEPAAGYDYNIALYGLDYIYAGTSQVVNTQEELDQLGNDPTSFMTDYLAYSNFTPEWLTLYVGYPVTNNSKHTFTLAVNNVEAPEETYEGYLDVELRHNAGGDLYGITYWSYISLDVTPLAQLLDGKKGITLKILTQQNGTKYLRFDLPAADGK